LEDEVGYTDGAWEQSNPSTDLQLFLGADQFTDFAGGATYPNVIVPGQIYQTVPTGVASKFVITPQALLLRSGQYATFGQQAFGTAAAVPGPSTVAGTSGPLALPQGRPPMTAAQMPTIAGSKSGPIPKGIQINSVDVLYQVIAAAATVATLGLTLTKFAQQAAPVTTNLIALGPNGLPTATGLHVQIATVAVPSAAMIVPTLDTQVVLNINLTAGAGGSINFYGAVLKCNYNFN